MTTTTTKLTVNQIMEIVGRSIAAPPGHQLTGFEWMQSKSGEEFALTISMEPVPQPDGLGTPPVMPPTPHAGGGKKVTPIKSKRVTPRKGK